MTPNHSRIALTTKLIEIIKEYGWTHVLLELNSLAQIGIGVPDSGEEFVQEIAEELRKMIEDWSND